VLGATIRSTTELEEVLADRRPDVVVKAIPSLFIDAARDQLLTTLRQSVHAVTATKSALVRGLDGLLAGAQASGRQLRYSAATAAALPTVDLIDTALRGATISGIQGVLNGTSTFVLSRMEAAHCSLGEAVREAQALGIAERDPKQDLNGVDTAAKLIIVNTICCEPAAPPLTSIPSKWKD
jgi:homoserine dehydrogenase